MPEFQPPFTIYWSHFTNGPSNQSIDRQHLWDNVEAIYNIIRNSTLEITDYAIYGIIAGSWAAGGLNPARIRRDYLIIDRVDEDPTILNGYGLWMDMHYDDLEDPQGYRQTEILLTNIINRRHYREYSNIEEGITTLSLRKYLAATNNSVLAWYWILNYTHYRFRISDYLLTAEYREFCAESYNAIKTYIETTSRKINPVAIAIFKKHKKRWWK